MVKKIHLTIDGQEISAPEEMSIAGAALYANIKIPTLCFMWGVNHVGACRVCVVEIEGEDQLVASCDNPVEEGMVVYTNSPKVRRARKMNVELLLSQHNVECASCVRSGNCQLQTVANDLNIIDSRFPSKLEKNEWPQDFPLIRDADKCIKCMRCIQICDKVQAVGVWDQKNRASRSTIGVTNAQPIEQSLCTLCGQCIVGCPVSALRERDDTDRIFEALADPDVITLAHIAPSVRASWGESLGLSHEQATVKRLVAALRSMGFDYIFDTAFAADMTSMEESSELVARLKEGDEHSWPMFSSCCPGWIRYIKGHHPDMLDQLSTTKSPQQMFGAIAKSWFAEKATIDAQRLFTVSITSCLAKKQECVIPGIDDAGVGHDVDAALTVREIDRLIKAEHSNVDRLVEEEFDSPLGEGSGAGVIFGVAGGVMEATLRNAYVLKTGENPDPDAFKEVRGIDGWKEATIDLAGTSLKVAVASGLGNAEKLIQALKAGEVSYDFVEIMACPGGCIGGGGQPITEQINRRKAERSKVLYGLDEHNDTRFSHENPFVISCYKEYLNEPLSERARHLLHTDHNNWKMPNEKQKPEEA